MVVLYVTVTTYTYCPVEEHATDNTDDDVVDDTETVFHVTPPSVETYTVDVGLVTDTYTYVPLDDTDTVVNPNTLELLDTTDDQVKYDVGATVGTGVGLPAVYVGDNEGAGVGLPAL